MKCGAGNATSVAVLWACEPVSALSGLCLVRFSETSIPSSVCLHRQGQSVVPSDPIGGWGLSSHPYSSVSPCFLCRLFLWLLFICLPVHLFRESAIFPNYFLKLPVSQAALSPDLPCPVVLSSSSISAHSSVNPSSAPQSGYQPC